MRKKNLLSKLLAAVMAVSMCAALFCAGIDKESAYVSAEADNVGVTNCWVGNCGHKSTYTSYGSYKVNSRYTNYYYTGFYLDPGVTQTIDFNVSVSQSLSVGGEVGSDVAKVSVGYTGGTTVSVGVSQSITNTANVRRYAHLGVERESRSNTITVKKRTYNPYWHITAVNKYCEYETSKVSVSCNVKTGCGLSLRSSK